MSCWTETAHRRGVPVTAIVQSYFGLAVFMRAGALDRLIGDGPRLSGAQLAVDTRASSALYAAVKRTPAIGSLALQNAVARASSARRSTRTSRS